MLVKGIIKTIDYNGNTCSVRIPTFESHRSDQYIVTAAISNQPGCYNGYKEEDVVWVGFDTDQYNQPVVLGKLYLGAAKEKEDPRGTVNAENTIASTSASIPFDTMLSNSVDPNIPNTQANYTSLQKLSNQMNENTQALSKATADFGNRITQLITDTDAAGTQYKSLVQQTARSLTATITAETKAREQADNTTTETLKSELSATEDRIDAKVSEMSTNVSDLTKTVQTNSSNIEATAKNLTLEVKSREELTEQVGTNAKKITGLDERLTTTETNISTINQTNKQITAEVSTKVDVNSKITSEKAVGWRLTSDSWNVYQRTTDDFTLSEKDIEYLVASAVLNWVEILIDGSIYYYFTINEVNTRITRYGSWGTGNNTGDGLTGDGISPDPDFVDDYLYDTDEVEIDIKYWSGSDERSMGYYWILRNIKHPTYWEWSDLKINTKPILVANEDGLYVSGNIEAETGHIGKFIIGNESNTASYQAVPKLSASDFKKGTYYTNVELKQEERQVFMWLSYSAGSTIIENGIATTTWYITPNIVLFDVGTTQRHAFPEKSGTCVDVTVKLGGTSLGSEDTITIGILYGHYDASSNPVITASSGAPSGIGGRAPTPTIESITLKVTNSIYSHTITSFTKKYNYYSEAGSNTGYLSNTNAVSSQFSSISMTQVTSYDSRLVKAGYFYFVKQKPSGIYSDGYLTAAGDQITSFAQVPNTNAQGIYIGTDGIRLGPDFSVSASGIVTAPTISIQMTDSQANSLYNSMKQIDHIAHAYGSTNSMTEKPTSWATSLDQVDQTNSYVWTKIETWYLQNGSVVIGDTSYSVSKLGKDGATGATGAAGPQGAQGEKGDTGAAGADVPYVALTGCDYSAGTNSTILIHGAANETPLATNARGHTFMILEPTHLVSQLITCYDTYATPNISDDALAYIDDALEDGYIILLVSYDACSVTDSLRKYLKSWGANSDATWTSERRAHVFVGMKGLAPGQAYEEIGDIEAGSVSSTVYLSASGIVKNGATGEKGEKGDTGATGAQGEKGDKGDTGENGSSISSETIHVYQGTTGNNKPNVLSVSADAHIIDLTAWSTNVLEPSVSFPYIWQTNYTKVTETDSSGSTAISYISSETVSLHTTLAGYAEILTANGIGIVSTSANPDYVEGMPDYKKYLYNIKADTLTGAIGSDVNIGGYANYTKLDTTATYNVATSYYYLKGSDYRLYTDITSNNFTEKVKSAAGVYIRTFMQGWTIKSATSSTDHAALYSGDVAEYKDASTLIDAEDTTGVYIGTDGIRLGNKFSVDPSGNVSATGLTINLTDTQKNDITKSIKQYSRVTTEYGIGTETNKPNTWFTSIDEIGAKAGDYVWTRTTLYYTTNGIETAEEPTYSFEHLAENGADGKNGTDGKNGSDGVGISSIEYYYASTSTSATPSADLITSDAMTSIDPTNKYLWQKEIIKLTDASTKTTITLLAAYGDTGVDGKDGTSGLSVFLTNPTVALSGDSNGPDAGQTAATEVLAYYGTDRLTSDSSQENYYTVGSISSTDHEVNISITEAKQCVITLTSKTTNQKLSGVITIPVVLHLSAKTINQSLDFSWNTTKQGKDGAPGKDGESGVAGQSISVHTNDIIFYYASTSNAAASCPPITYDSSKGPDVDGGGNWTTVDIAPTAANPYIWKRVRLVTTTIIDDNTTIECTDGDPKISTTLDGLVSILSVDGINLISKSESDGKYNLLADRISGAMGTEVTIGGGNGWKIQSASADGTTTPAAIYTTGYDSWREATNSSSESKSGVYIGTNGISCGTGFSVNADGTVIATKIRVTVSTKSYYMISADNTTVPAGPKSKVALNGWVENISEAKATAQYPYRWTCMIANDNFDTPTYSVSYAYGNSNACTFTYDSDSNTLTFSYYK